MREIFRAASLPVWYDRIWPAGLPGSVVAGDIPFFLAQARRTGGPVLELGVGTGRVAIPLAQAGFDVTGVDVAPGMLAACRAKSVMAGVASRIDLVRDSMSRFALPGRRFRLALIPFRAFMHVLEPAAQRATLTRVRRHLVRGGRLVIDVFDPLLSKCAPEHRTAGGRRGSSLRVASGAGRTLRIRFLSRANDAFRQTLKEVWEFEELGPRRRVVRRERVAVELRWTYRWEMRYLLEACGFEVLACHGDFRGGPARYGADQVWVARAR